MWIKETGLFLCTRAPEWESKLMVGEASIKGGKEVQIKAVAQAVSTYVMSCYLLPQDTCKKLSAAVARFWWSTGNNNRGLHWVAWDKICVPEEEGGLGFRDFRDFNLALLAKQVWRLLTSPQSLLARVLKGRYYRHSNPLRTGKANSPSFGWSSLMAAKPVLANSLRRTIGTGAETKVWEDVWIPTAQARAAKPKTVIVDPDLKVHHLIDFDNKDWNIDLLNEVIAAEDIPRILSLRISKSGRRDGYCWKHTTSGCYTVKSGYAIAVEQRKKVENEPILEPSCNVLKKKVWKLKAPKKIKHFLWQALSGFVASASKLKERHCGSDTVCQRCGADIETINHILFECPPAVQCWALSLVPSSPGYFPCSSIYVNFDILLQLGQNSTTQNLDFTMFPWLIWYLWKARNDKCFNNKDAQSMDTLLLARNEAEAWKLAQINPEEILIGAADEVRQNVSQAPNGRWKCQTDASWTEQGDGTGLGFTLFEGAIKIATGQRKLDRQALLCKRRRKA